MTGACGCRRRLGPLEIRIRDRVPVRIMCRKSEHLVDALLELFRQGVLQSFCFAVDLVHVDAERLREIELQQAVVADDLERDFLAGVRERDSAVGLMDREVERCELLHHRARRGGRNALALRQCGDGHAGAVRAELVDLAQVVLDRVGKTGLSHRLTVCRLRHYLSRSGPRASAASGLVLATQNRDSSTGGGTRLDLVRIRVGHSADPDDAFMAWGLVSGQVDSRGFEFEFVPEDIQVLNEWALEGRLEVTALSLATYPLVQDRYALLPHGASIGSGYGPIVVAREELSPDDLQGVEIAVPGRLTTAFLVLGMALDLGEWWLLETGLPLPLGVNVARRDVPRLGVLSSVLRESIETGLAHRDEATQYALGFARDLDVQTADRFIEMYVNELTCDYGDEGRQAVAELLRRAEASGAYEEPVRIEFVDS